MQRLGLELLTKTVNPCRTDRFGYLLFLSEKGSAGISAVFFCQFGKLPKLGNHITVAAAAVRHQTGAAIFGAIGQPLAVAAASRTQRVKRTVAEQAVEILRFFGLVTREKLTALVMEKGIAAVLGLHAQTFLFFAYHTRYPISLAPIL